MDFDNWYQDYPRKVGRKAAEREWSRLTKSEQAQAISALPEHIKAWRGTAMHYIPHPRTWLCQGRWDDELQVPIDRAAEMIEQMTPAQKDRELYLRQMYPEQYQGVNGVLESD